MSVITLDILGITGVKDAVKRKRLQQAAQVIAGLVLITILFAGFTGGDDLRFEHRLTSDGSLLGDLIAQIHAKLSSAGYNFATTAVWYLWYPVLAFTVIIFGRLWCGICPVGAFAGFVNKFSLRRAYPSHLSHMWLAVGLFILISATERHLFRYTRSPIGTAALLGFFIVLAVGMSLVYEKRTFCRYICPTGLILGMYSMLAGTELRCISRKECVLHEKKECIEGNEHGRACPLFEFPQTMERNNFCTYCTECVRTCSKDNIRISTRLPASDVMSLRSGSADEAFFVHSVIAVMLFLTGMEHIGYRRVVTSFVLSTGIDRTIMAPVILTAVSILAALFMYILSSTKHSERRDSFVVFSYALLPMSLGVYLAAISFKMVSGIMFIFNTIGISSGELSSFESVHHIQSFLLLAGAAWSAYLVYDMTRRSEKSGSQMMILLLLALYLASGLFIINMPVA